MMSAPPELDGIPATEVVCGVGSFGERLQREREMRGITLEEIAEATKIGTRSLRALEEQDFDKLPGGIFNKGFVRAYSRYLGIDEEQAVTDYIAALTEAQAAGHATRPEPGLSLAAEKETVAVGQEDREPSPIPWVPLIALAIVLAAAFAGWRYVSRHGLPRLRAAQTAGVRQRSAAGGAQARIPPQPAPIAAASPVSATPTAAAADSAAPRARAAGVPDAAPLATTGFVLRLRAKEESWVSVVADGKPVMSGVLPAATEKTVRAQSKIVLKTGNAGGLDLFRNQEALPPLGTDKQVRQVTITATDVQQ